jgi:hypothetical protein
MAPEHKSILAPSELRRLAGWLIWKYETQPGTGKQLKVPYYVDGGRRHGRQGSPEDRAKLTTFADARDAAARKGFSGVGFAMLPDWGLTALDFDKCVDEDGKLPTEIGQIVARTYAEYSPSGKGIRAFVRGNLGNHKSAAEPGRFGYETFNSTGFVTFTGRVLPVVELCDFQDTISDVNDDVTALCEARFGKSTAGALDNDDPFAGFEPRLDLSVEKMEAYLDVLDADMPREQWIRVGMALHHETEADDTGLALWDEWSARGGKYPSREALQSQWDSFTRRMGPGRRQVTMASVIKMAKEAGQPQSGPASASEMKALAADTLENMGPQTSSEDVCTPDGFLGKYPVASAEAVSLRPDPEWLVHGVLPDADLVVLFGASGSGKSFAALDLAASVALGTPWRERRVRKGRVIVIAAEGGGGVGKRLRAYCQHHGMHISQLKIGVITAAPNFLERDEIAEVVSSVVAAGGADLLIADTFAQVTPGANENAGEDMGVALGNARVLREATGAVVLLIHHAGKDASKGARGWSGIKAAADAEIEIIRHEEGGREMRVSKMKDGDDGLQWGFKLEVVPLGTDKYGEPVTSCVAIEAAVPIAPATAQERRNVKKVGRFENIMLDAIEQVDPTVQFMMVGLFLDLCVNTMPLPDEGKRDIRRQNLARALENLTKGDEPALTVAHGKVYFCK